MTDKDAFFNSIISIIKAFDGDIYGSIIRDFKINKSTDISNINCRIDVHLITLFTQTLSVMFDVRELPAHIGGIVALTKRYLLTPKRHSDTTSITLEVAIMTKYEWNRMPCDLDVNLFAENNNSRYVRVDYQELKRFADRYDYLMDRIQQRRFCILDFSVCKSLTLTRAFIENASKMVSKGWTMDDMIWGDDTCVINRWITYQMRPTDVRVRYNADKIERLLAQDECMLCNERFAPTDIVINTRCSHNFHWGPCHSPDDNGLKCRGLVEWVRRDKLSCPCCRASMF
jgi:hypothetical protein